MYPHNLDHVPSQPALRPKFLVMIKSTISNRHNENSVEAPPHFDRRLYAAPQATFDGHNGFRLNYSRLAQRSLPCTSTTGKTSFRQPVGIETLVQPAFEPRNMISELIVIPDREHKNAMSKTWYYV